MMARVQNMRTVVQLIALGIPGAYAGKTLLHIGNKPRTAVWAVVNRRNRSYNTSTNAAETAVADKLDI